jgi:uncharacterized protein (TIGR02453 family)
MSFHSVSPESEYTMRPSHDFEPALRFLSLLKQNNHKHWFDQNRLDYQSARGIFADFINDLIDEFRESDRLQGLSAGDCIFRINRDVRFSKDKSPYKTNLSAIIAPGGRKAMGQGYYISVEPHGQSMVAGGMYAPEPEQLNRFRRSIDHDASAFKQLIHAKDFLEAFGPLEGDRLKNGPKGYDQSHPEIELLKLKQITAVHRFSDPEVLAEDFSERVISVCRAMKLFLVYLNDL